MTILERSAKNLGSNRLTMDTNLYAKPRVENTTKTAKMSRRSNWQSRLLTCTLICVISSLTQGLSGIQAATFTRQTELESSTYVYEGVDIQETNEEYTLDIGDSSCGYPGSPRNGSVDSAVMLYRQGEEVTFTCQEGFVLFGPDKRTCRRNGTWSDTIPECRRNLALGKSSLQSSTLWNYEPALAVDSDPDTCSFTPRSTEQRWWQVHLDSAASVQAVAVTISPGSYQKFTIFVIELLEGNKAMYKPCSKFEGKFETKKAVFLCNDGLGHPGQFVYIRDDREEQEYFGLCEVEVFEFTNSTMCGDPEQPVFSIVNRTSPSTVQYSCVKGHRMEGGTGSTRHCSDKGVWIGSPPKCVEVQCVDPLSVKDGFIEVSNFKGRYVFGSLATYHCNPGYILWGNASRLCAENGKWTGKQPQCKPITCGQPPEVLNARFYLTNGTSTAWQSLARYSCKPGFKMIYQDKNLTEIATICTESGIWQPITFNCVFDPLAINLKKSGSIGGWVTFGEDGNMNLGTIATIGVLATLILLVLVVVIIFFTHRRLNDENGPRKVSRSSTNQLIADVANGLAAHIEGPSPNRGSNNGSQGDGGHDGQSSTMVLHSTPQTPMHQMTQFQQHQKYVDDPNVQYSLNGSITSPVVGNCSIVGSLRRNDVRMIDSPIHQHQHSINDATSMGSSVNVCTNNQQPCSPMISFKPMGNNNPGSNQQIPVPSGILASPLPQPPSNYNKASHLDFKSELTNSINITMNPVDGKCFDANNSLIINNMQNASTVLGCSSSEGSRSAGDGGSESNYATVNDKSNQKNSILCDEDDEEEEESHYSLIRKPDGQADEGPYSTLRESQRTESSGDDAGYESLHNNHPSSQSSLIRNIQNSNLQHEPRYASLGIDSPEVREQVYETLKKHSSGYENVNENQKQFYPQTGNTSLSQPQVGNRPKPVATNITGISGFASPLNARRQQNSQRGATDGSAATTKTDAMALYARVDRSKKKKNRDSGGGSSDNCSSGQSSQACTPSGDDNLDGSSGVGSDVAPLSFQSSHGPGLKNINENSSYEQSTKLSPTKTLIQKFNNIGLETSSNNNQSDRQKQYSFNDTDNPTPSKTRSISDTNPPQNSNKPSVRVTSNPRHTSYPHIPPVASEPSSTNSNTSSSSFASKNNSTNTSAFKYRPKTLNTATATPSDKNQEHVKPSNISSKKLGSLNRNEPVYATVGSVNSNQRLVKNLKSANV